MRGGALLCLLTLLLAGCSSPSEETAKAPPAPANFEQKEEGDEGVDVEVEEQDPEVELELRVTVREPGGQALAEAQVAVLSTPLSGLTDADGTVVFRNLTAGPARLRVTPAQDYYKVVEVNLTIRSAAVTKATVTVPVADGLLTPPHQHGDAWARGDVVELFSTTHIDFRCAGLQSYCYDAQARNQYRPFPFQAVVPPGTGRIDVQAAWSSPTSSPFYLDIRGPGLLALDQRFATSGDIVSVEVGHDNTDVPHATLSAWTYQWSPDLTGAQFGVWEPPFVITVTAVRGDYVLPIDPPHPDHWGDRTRIRVGQATDTADPAESYWGATGVNTAPARSLDQGVVFPGTDRLEFRAWINHTLPHDPPMDLWYRPNPDTPWTQLTADTADGVLYGWDVPVHDGWYDSIYATTSSWSYKVQSHSQVPPEPPNQWGIGYDGGYALHVVVTAVKQGE